MAKPRARRRPRCSFVEDGRLCPRVGTGNPLLCDRHFRLIQERGPEPADDTGAAGVIGDLLRGKKVSRERLGTAAVGIAAGIFAAFGGAAASASGGVGRQQRDPMIGFAPFAPFAPFTPITPPGQSGPRPRPAPYDPEAAHRAAEARDLKAARVAARRVMGLPQTFSRDELKACYRKLAKKHHPDRKGGSVAAMAAVNHANDVLTAELG